MSHVDSSRFSDFAGDYKAFCEGKKQKYEYDPQIYDENNMIRCHIDLYPYHYIRRDYFREPDPLKKRIERWLRQIGREEGYDIPPYEDDMDISPTEFFWLCTIKETPPPDPLAKVVDPKLAKDFRFVQKQAYKKQMSERESRRLHIVFRASTDEKIKRIKELCKSLAILRENEDNAAVGKDDDESRYYEDSHDGTSNDDSSFGSSDESDDDEPWWYPLGCHTAYSKLHDDDGYNALYEDAQNYCQNQDASLEEG